MGSLSEQYAIEVAKIDSVIYQKLIKALESNPREEKIDGLDGKEMELLCNRLNTRRRAIMALFEGNFAYNQSKIREQLEKQLLQKRKKVIDQYSRLANEMLRQKVDTALDELIEAKDCSALEASIGIDRKTFIDAVLDENIDIDLKKDKEKTEEDTEDR